MFFSIFHLLFTFIFHLHVRIYYSGSWLISLQSTFLLKIRLKLPHQLLAISMHYVRVVSLIEARQGRYIGLKEYRTLFTCTFNQIIPASSPLSSSFSHHSFHLSRSLLHPLLMLKIVFLPLFFSLSSSQHPILTASNDSAWYTRIKHHIPPVLPGVSFHYLTYSVGKHEVGGSVPGFSSASTGHPGAGWGQ